jgi:GntR family transcriptional regulator
VTGSAGGAPRYRQAAALVRARIAAGDLAPGEPAPSGAELARVTGFASLTCRKAIRTLIKDGTLVPGPSPNARPRVAGPRNGGQAPADAARDLSAALAARRHAAGLTQKELADLAGFSVTTVGHAETGRAWQSRRFWEHADKTLNACGELLDLHDAYRAAAVLPEGDAAADPGPPDPAPGPPKLVRILLIWSDGSTTLALPDPSGGGVRNR